MQQLYTIFWLIGLVILLTIFQNFYFKILYKLKTKSSLFNAIFSFIIRFGIIIHEFCHAFFAFLTGNKITKINLFSKTGGSVELETKNYIGALSQNGFSGNFLFKLILNQFGLFFVSFGPLIFGVGITFFILNLFGISGLNDVFDYEYNIYFICFLLFYSIFIPSFVLSFEDIKKFFFSKQENLGATIMGSILNFIIFLLFVFIFGEMFSTYFYFFSVLFFILFIFQVFVYFFIEMTILFFRQKHK